ncbi:MAG: VWA domain-containing protein [Candidatus Adiutrix sp.]|jgi:hypothetical protein|nr:VWA domain-containing protein [Candidatus Adiutrix sp.]
MKKLTPVTSSFIAAMLGLSLLFVGPAVAQPPRAPLMVEGKSALPLRVLTRPMSNLYQKADEKSPVVQGNLPAFSNYFVYTKPGGEKAALGQGWYEVGANDKGDVVGWLRADDVFEWLQTMCLAYTNPSGREPVLMFESRRPLEDLIKKAPTARAEGVKALYETIESKKIPANFPVVSVEPKLAVDIAKQFYLLPILDFKVIEMDGREGRLLELAAATAGGPGTREKSDIRTNSDYLGAASLTAADATRKNGENLTVEIVWVIDTTVSMSPYIAQTLQVVTDVSERLANQPDLSERVKFGVWGYRDPVEDIPTIEYTTKNYTPKLQSVADFVKTMGQVEETKVDSVDFPEDVFSGLNDALYQTDWRPDSLKIMVLVGDAPGHELGHKWNLTGLDAEKFHALASDKKVTLMALQVRPNGGKRFQRLAEDQFRTLSAKAGSELYFDVNSGDLDSFATATDLAVDGVVKLVAQALAASGAGGTSAGAGPGTNSGTNAGTSAAALLGGDGGQPAPNTAISGELAALLADDEAQDAKLSDKEKDFKANLDKALQAALVDWLGSTAEAQAPRDITAWAVDKDLTDSNMSSLEVRLLINKRQLDSLSTILSDVIKAGRTSGISGDDFFTSLQAASAMASRDPEKLSQAADFGQSGLVPEFLEGLPYHSRLMSINNDLWNSMSPDEQDNFVNMLEANVKAYQQLHNDPGGWVALNEGDDADDMVYPIPLDLLP